MRVVLTRKMVVGHVMRYPGEVVDVPDEDEGIVDVAVAPDAAEFTATMTAVVPEDVHPTPRRRRKQI